MRIDIKLEDNKPVLILSKAAGLEKGDKVTLYNGEHCPAEKTYTARLKRPTSEADIKKALNLLKQWINR